MTETVEDVSYDRHSVEDVSYDRHCGGCKL